MKKYRCEGIVPDCHVTFGGEDDKIEELALQHVQRDHGLSEVGDEQRRQIRSNILVD